MGAVRILQETSDNQQFVLTIPKAIVQSKGWKKGDKFQFVDNDKNSLIIVKVEDET